MTGYDQGPDYGGRPFMVSDYFLIATMVAIVGAGVLLVAFIHTL